MARKRSWKFTRPKKDWAWTWTRYRSALPSCWSNNMTRREWLATISAAPLLNLKAANAAATDAPTAPVAIARCASYEEDLAAKLGSMFDQLGGIEKLVRNKTVTIKINMTGATGMRVQGLALGRTHYTHPKLVAATAFLLGR